jgi:hypothetical protein
MLDGQSAALLTLNRAVLAALHRVAGDCHRMISLY